LFIKNSKAQISIEVLLILGILVIGGILFGIYYLSSVNKKISASSTVDNIYSYSNMPITQSDGASIPAGPLQINVSVPDQRPINQLFEVNVRITQTPPGINVNQYIVKKIEIFDFSSGATSNVCVLDGNYPSGVYNLSTLFANSNQIFNFSCSNLGNFEFKATVDLMDDTESGNDVSDTDDIIIVPPIVSLGMLGANCTTLSNIASGEIRACIFDNSSSLNLGGSEDLGNINLSINVPTSEISSTEFGKIQLWAESGSSK
jgi:hypothetical protein